MRFQTLFEGRWIFAILLVLAGASALISWWLTFLFVALILYTVAFFEIQTGQIPAINALWSRRQTARSPTFRKSTKKNF